MAMNIVVPTMGESVVEATVARWLKHEGDRVEVGDPLVELETDKVNLEVGSERGGVLAHIERKEGEDVHVGDVLAVLEEAEALKGEGGEGQKKGEAEVDVKAEAKAGSLAEEGPSERAGNVTPVARRMAEEQRVDLERVEGSGPGGKVTKEDVERYLDQQAAQQAGPQVAGARAAPATPGRPAASAPAPEVPRSGPPPSQPVGAGRSEERVRMSRRRQTIARRLVEAQHTAAMLTTFNEVDMTAIMEIRARRKDSFKERYGINLGIMSFFVKASIGALKAYPRLNAEIQGGEQPDAPYVRESAPYVRESTPYVRESTPYIMVLKHYYDIGVAIGAEEGLVVPVLRDADRMSFAEIERAIKRYVQQTEEGTLALEDLRGGTFTITNGGVYGSLMSTPILNPPQVGILGMHKIQERAVVVDGQVAIRRMMYVALSYDHRIVDGREAVQFLVRLKELAEDPEALLIEG